MAEDFILPDIGEGIVECEVVEWLVAEGDYVTEDQPICDVMTDKALVQIPAIHKGIITKFYCKKGEIAQVHAPLFAMNVCENKVVKEQTSTSVSVQVAQMKDPCEDFILPDIGEGIVECEIVEWLVKEGQTIVEDQAVCDVMTDKALVQIPAKYSGIVLKQYYQKGDIAKVHSPLYQMSISNSVIPQSVEVKEKIERTLVSNTEQLAPSGSSNSIDGTLNTKTLASPAIRRKAREMGIDLNNVSGSGENGRIYEQDLEKFAYSDRLNINTSCNNKSENYREESIEGIKSIMAKQVIESVYTIPHFTFNDEIDLTQLISLRNDLKEDYKALGVNLTMMPFFIKALSLAIKQFPVLNSKVDTDCTTITYINEHNIGVAVDSKNGLFVPNIKSCESKTITSITDELTRLKESVRAGRVDADDLKGGTISISNIGTIGGTTSTSIINKSEVAIVSLGRVQQLPRFDDAGNVVASSIMQISWSGDHRVIDGATIARFNNLWKLYIEEPNKMMMAMS